MRKLTILASMFVLGTLLSIAMPNAMADAGNWLTYLTFSAPVEVPGMVLVPGTYQFQLLDSGNSQKEVVIRNSKGTALETVSAVPAYRTRVTGQTKVTFEKRGNGSPLALKDWFYPGDSYGVHFVYNNGKATRMAMNK